MNTEALLARLIQHEGLKLRLYKDTANKWTVGIGRNIEDRGISEDEARYLCLNDIALAEKQLDKHVPSWRELNDVRQQVLAEMVFNMGINRFLGFQRTIEAVEQHDYVHAAYEMLNSLWAKQVGQRARTLADAMETGKF